MVDSVPSLTEQLAAILRRPVGAVERQRAIVHVRDWLACAILGATANAGQTFVAYGRGQQEGPCSTIGVGGCAADMAAFVNGSFGNIYEVDDTHRMSVLHPGDTAIPAALAVAEREGATGSDLLAAIVRGYEATIRVGELAGTTHYRHWYSTATCGVFGAAIAAASILKLDGAGLKNALGNAGMQSSGLWQCRMEPCDSKQLATARAAQAGVMAADLAAAGLTAPRFILEGEHGLLAATGVEPPSSAILEPGAWKIWETSFKPWPACRATHPVIEAGLMARTQLDPAAIARIGIKIFGQAITMCDQPAPRTPHEGRFSLQHCVAAALLWGAPKLAHFEPPFLDRPDVVSLRTKVTTEASDELTAAFPSRLGLAMKVTLKDGSERDFELWTAKGDPENPMSEAELQEKAFDLITAAGVGRTELDHLLAAVEELDRAPDLKFLSAALAAIGQEAGPRRVARTGTN